MKLDIQSTPQGVLVVPDGALTGADAAAFAEQFKGGVPEGSVATLDFAAVPAVDIEGLRKLITVDRWLKGRGGRLILSSVSDDLRNLLKTNGVDGMFEIVQSAPAAPRREAAAPAPAPPPAAAPAPTPAPTTPPATPPAAAPPPARPAAPPPAEPSTWQRPASPASPAAPVSRPATPAPAEPSAWERPASPPVPELPAWERPPSPDRPARTPAPPREPEPPEPDIWSAPTAPALRSNRPAAGPPVPAPVPEDAWSAPAPAPDRIAPKSPAVSPPGAVPDLPEETGAWTAPGAAAPAAPGPKPGTTSGGGSKWLLPALLAAALAGGAVWWFGFRKTEPPAVSSLYPGLDVLLEPGTPPDFRIVALHSDTITAEGGRLPGLEFRVSALDGVATGSFSGEVGPAESSGPVTVTFTPRRGDVAGPPTTVTFTVRTPLLFEQTEFRTEAGRTFSARVVSGASSCRVEPKPVWLSLGSEQSAGRTVWNIGGTPPTAGTTTLKVVAADVSGQEKEQEITLTVTAPAPVTPPATPPVVTVQEEPADPGVPGDAQEAPPVVVASPPPPKGHVPEKLRRMIRARMDAMSAQRLSPAMRIQINNGLDNMESAAVIAAVGFSSNSARLDSRAEALIERRLADPDIKPLLDSPRRQLIVIGYASPKGSAAHNLALSRSRAEAVAAFLSSRGYRPRFTDGYGETRIVGSDDASNQAVEIYVVVPTEGYVDPMEELANQLERLRSLMTAEEAK